MKTPATTTNGSNPIGSPTSTGTSSDPNNHHHPMMNHNANGTTVPNDRRHRTRDPMNTTTLSTMKKPTTTTPRSSSASKTTTTTTGGITTPKNSLWARSHVSRGLTIDTTTSTQQQQQQYRPLSLPTTTSTTTTTTNINERLYHSPTKSSLSKQQLPLSPPKLSSSSSPRIITTTPTQPRGRNPDSFLATTTRRTGRPRTTTPRETPRPPHRTVQQAVGAGCGCCGIHCVCDSLHHCDGYEELCQGRAYRIIQSVHQDDDNDQKIATTHSHLPPHDHRPGWKLELLVRGMTCTMCSQAVNAAIRKAMSEKKKNSTVQHIDISLVTDTVTVEWNTRSPPTESNPESLEPRDVMELIRTAITAIGYNVDDEMHILPPRPMTRHDDAEHPPAASTGPLLDNDADHHHSPHHDRTTMSVEDRWQRYRQRQNDKVEYRRGAFAVALLLTLPVLLITMVFPYVIPHRFQQYQQRIVAIPYLHVSVPLEGLVLWIFATPVQFICGYEFYKMAWFGFWSGRAGMDLLVAIGTTASYLYALHGVFRTSHTTTTTADGDTAHFFETSTILIVFVLAGKWMQAAAVRRTSDAITQLMSLQSPTAIRITPQQQQQRNDGTTSSFNPLCDPYLEEVVNVQDIVVGDMVKVIRGASIPVDGCVLFGDIAVDESMMTGESLPIVKMKGSIVLGGTVCVESSSIRHNASTPTSGGGIGSGSGSVSPNHSTGNVGAAFIQVTGVGSSSALAKIVDLVQQAQSRAVPIQTFADQVSAIFVPTVCAISLVTYLVWYALCSSNVVPVEWYRDELGEDSVTFSIMFAIACLVISCPCALGLATPTAIMVGTGVGAKCGILMKGGSALEVASKVNTVIFDKTGTLTKGVPTVSDMIHLPTNQKTDTTTEDYMLWVLGSLERTSEHPLAKAIVKYAEERLGDVLETNPFVHPTEFQTVTGRGASGIIGGNVEVAVGNRSFASIMGLAITTETDLYMQRMEEVGKTAIIVALNGNVCLVLGIVDQVKDDATASIAYLRDIMGMDVWMVTGDNSRTAAAISQQVGLSSDRVIAEALPATKLEKVRSLQSDGRSVVCMVGDGINDSAALAQADVGIGMGSGADIATEASDMILVKGHVTDVCTALHLSRALFRRIQWNLTLSLIYNCLGIPVAVGLFYPFVHVRLPPTIAAVAMALSSISVVLSSLTLRFYRPPNVFHRRRHLPRTAARGRSTLTTNGDVDDMRLALLASDHLATQSNN